MEMGRFLSALISKNTSVVILLLMEINGSGVTNSLKTGKDDISNF